MADQHGADQAMGEQVTKIGEDVALPCQSLFGARHVLISVLCKYVVHANVCSRAVFRPGVFLAYLGYFNG